MAKNRKHSAKTSSGQSPKAPAPATLAAHPPARQPTLLAVSVALFVLWFIFLTVTALSSLK